MMILEPELCVQGTPMDELEKRDTVVKAEVPETQPKPSVPRIPERKLRHFSKVREARDAIRDEAVNLLTIYKKNVEAALQAGDYKTVQDSIEWLFLHMPPDEDGNKVVDQDLDKPKADSGKSGPTINLGFAIGGLGVQKELLPPKEAPEAIQIEEVDEDPT